LGGAVSQAVLRRLIPQCDFLDQRCGASEYPSEVSPRARSKPDVSPPSGGAVRSPGRTAQFLSRLRARDCLEQCYGYVICERRAHQGDVPARNPPRSNLVGHAWLWAGARLSAANSSDASTAASVLFLNRSWRNVLSRSGVQTLFPCGSSSPGPGTAAPRRMLPCNRTEAPACQHGQEVPGRDMTYLRLGSCSTATDR
jgi:hypothetical protein